MKLLILASAAAALLTGGVAAQDMEVGAGIFARYCATCHGVEARGNGPMASALLLAPPDLTGLSARNNGVFPVIRVVKRIDGRDPLVSHGSPMPVYGSFFEGDDTALKAETGQPIMTSRAIVDLLTWLQSVQE